MVAPDAMSTTKKLPSRQRAIVFQGGGALGAYEAGVFHEIYDRLSSPDQPLFDIVAGTSAGAINASILVSYVKEHKTWEGSAQKLVDFWKHLASPTPFIAESYGYVLGESARRYYSTKYFFYEGANNVFSAPQISPDLRFHDYLPFFNFKANVNPNTSFVYSNDWWKQSLEHYYKDRKKFVTFPLSTRYEHGEPRLLVVSVDVAEGAVITFDSYSKESKYGRHGKELNEYKEQTIRYEKGLMPVHVMASAALPPYFDFRRVPTDYDYDNLDREEDRLESKAARPFWDGGVLSNTPLRELLSEHKRFWMQKIEDSELSRDMWIEKEEESGKSKKDYDSVHQVPDLDVFIVNVWPKLETGDLSDHEVVKDRKNDIAYCDKTDYDQKVALLVSDYIKLAREIRKFALDHVPQDRKDEFKKGLDNYLKNNLAHSKHRNGERRNFEDILKGRFKLVNVVTIERSGDIFDISNKWADFTEESIQGLIDKGINDAKMTKF